MSAKHHTFTNYLEAVFFAYMHEHSICPLTHEGISFYFGEIYEHTFDDDKEFKYEIRDDLHFLVDDRSCLTSVATACCSVVAFIDIYICVC